MMLSLYKAVLCKQYRPAHEILLLTIYAQKPALNANIVVSTGARGLVYGLSLPLLPYFV